MNSTSTARSLLIPEEYENEWTTETVILACGTAPNQIDRFILPYLLTVADAIETIVEYFPIRKRGCENEHPMC